MSTLYVAVDLFHAASYRPLKTPNRPATHSAQDEIYEHDEGFIYLVLQPLLLFSDGQTLSPALSDYLSNWKATKLGKPGAVTFLTREVIDALPKGVIGTPVPFPNDVNLRLELSWNGVGSFTIDRDPVKWPNPFRFETAVWPDFAALNYMAVPIRKYGHFSSTQIDQLFSWAYDLMKLLRKMLDPQYKPQPGEPPLSKPSANELAIYQSYFKDQPLDFPTGLLPLDVQGWRKVLVENGKLANLLGDIWALKDLRAEKNLNPPPFTYSSSALFNLKAAAFETLPGVTYHEFLVDQLVEVEKAEETADPKLAIKARTAHRALARLFGFGERLRFPGKPDYATEKHFMLVRTDVEQRDDISVPNDWFTTNVPSLLGQVFRIGPISNALANLDATIKELSVCGSQLPPDDSTAAGEKKEKQPRNAIKLQMEAMYLEAKANAARKMPFGASVTRPDSEDRVEFLPRHARPQSTRLQHKPTGKTIYAVPGSMLDLLEPLARREMSEGQTPDSNLAQSNLQRMLIGPDDLAEGGGYTDWSAADRYIRFKVALNKIPIVCGPAADVAYELTLAQSPHPKEAKSILDGLKKAAEGELGKPKAELWISQAKSGVETLEVFSLSNTNAVLNAAGTSLTILDIGKKLTDLLPKGGGISKSAEETAHVDLAWNVGSGKVIEAEEQFNVVLQTDVTDLMKNVSPMLISPQHFEHRVSRSADRILGAFDLKFSPPVPENTFLDGNINADAPILAHFANFNKLRLDLADDANNVLQLNHPDALVPIAPFKDNGYKFWFSHLFSEEIRQRLGESEANRYRAYATAGQDWKIAGRVEHQYSHKVPVDGTHTVTLPLSSEISNLASLSVQPEKEKAGGVETKLPFFALTFDMTTGPEKLVLSMELEYLTRVIGAAAETPSALRPLYEALVDLKVGAAEALPIIRLEKWNFDNKKRTPDAGNVGSAERSQDFPNIADSMRFAGAAEKILTADDWKPFTNLLGATFEDFAKAVKGTSTDLMIEIAVDKSWTWKDNTGKPVADPELPLSNNTNVVRTGLRVARAANRVIGKGFVDSPAKFSPMKLVADVAQTEPELTKVDNGRLQMAAFKELKEWIDGESPLRTSFGWVRSFDASREKKLQARREAAADLKKPVAQDGERALKLMGDSYLFLNFPDDLALPEEKVVRLFHVPFGFIPLKGHPAFGDPQTTMEFAQYVIEALTALANGVKPASLGVAETATIKAARQDHGDLLFLLGKRGIAAMIAQLVRPVDPVASGFNPLPSMPPDEVFLRVCESMQGIEMERKNVLLELLAADPSIYNFAKGIAIGVFDPETFSESLFAVQVRKQIHETTANTMNLVADDRDRFTFARFFGKDKQRFLVDVLDDKSYDDDYQIEESQFKPIPNEKPLTPKLRSNLTRRGDAQARQAEDVLEDVNLFVHPNDEDKTKPRAIEAQVQHYNPEWKTPKGNFYLLPSRRFPRTPKGVLTQDPGNTRTVPFKIVYTDPLEAQFQKALIDAQPNEVKIGSSGQSLFIAKKSTPPREARVPVSEARKWHQLDSYVSHYYFVVEPDEEESFANDVFQISVQRSKTAFAPSDGEKQVEFEAKSPLQRWFVYNRLKEKAKATGSTAQLPKPPDITFDELLKEARRWFTSPNPDLPFRNELLLEPPAKVERVAPEDNVLEKTARFSPRVTGWELENDPISPDPGDMGNVIYAELMEISDPDNPTQKITNSLLHIAILDDVWSYQRVNVRTLRNGRDLNGDHRVDINPEFQMLSKPSSWMDNGRETIVFSTKARTLPIDIGTLNAALTSTEWLNKPTAQPLGVNLTDLLKARLGSSQMFYWNQSLILADAVMVSAVVLQEREDTHPFQKGDLPLKDSVPERGDVIIRWIFGKIKASQIDDLTKTWESGKIVAIPLQLKVTWWNESNSPVLEVTWPIKWRH